MRFKGSSCFFLENCGISWSPTNCLQGHRMIGNHFFDKPWHLESNFYVFDRFQKKSCRNFYWRKKKWEKQNGLSYETVDSEIGLHRSPKCSSMIFCVCYAFLQLHLPGFVKIWRIAPSVVKNTSNLDFEKFLFFWKITKILKKFKNFKKSFSSFKAPESSQGVFFYKPLHLESNYDAIFDYKPL